MYQSGKFGDGHSEGGYSAKGVILVARDRKKEGRQQLWVRRDVCTELNKTLADMLNGVGHYS